eukprot:Sspe_Gene.48570::Locus_25413_Transcript_1_1_Confidence_1.000_Length_4431::g.48570::m.48570
MRPLLARGRPSRSIPYLARRTSVWRELCKQRGVTIVTGPCCTLLPLPRPCSPTMLMSVMKSRVSDNGAKRLSFKVPVRKHGVFKCGILVKGCSTVLVHSCAFSKNGDSSILVEANYDAPVIVRDCTFAEEKKTVLENFIAGKHKPKKGPALSRVYSIPAKVEGCTRVSYASQLPDVVQSAAPVDDTPPVPPHTKLQEVHSVVRPLHNFVFDPYYAMGTTRGIEVVTSPVTGSQPCWVLLGAAGGMWRHSECAHYYGVAAHANMLRSLCDE